MLGSWRIANEGWGVLALFGTGTILLSVLYLPLGCIALGVMLWLAFILREPQRVGPSDDAAVVAPADGRVVEIAKAAFPDDDAHPAWRITIAIGLADMQLQLSPITGRVQDNFTLPGLFGFTDDREQMRRFNEKREIMLVADTGAQVAVVQYASRTARRLICRHQEGKYLTRGTPLGMAPMAGVVELYLPETSAPQVRVGMRVIAGETVLAVTSGRAGRASSSGRRAAGRSHPSGGADV